MLMKLAPGQQAKVGVARPYVAAFLHEGEGFLGGHVFLQDEVSCNGAGGSGDSGHAIYDEFNILLK